MAQSPNQSTNIFDALEDQPSSPSTSRSASPIRSAKVSRRSSPLKHTTPNIDPDAIKLAAEKLRRQNERNAQSEAAIDDIMKSRGGQSSRAKKWKPFDFQTDDGSSQMSDSAAVTPLDVHAKVFQPTPQSTRVSTITSYSATAEEAFDDDGEFQVITGRRARPNIHAQTETPQITSTAPLSKKEISQVFGNDLPSPGYCQSHPGTQHGQVQFCIHPNGDISAQQWSQALYQWVNIGQYSNVRRKTEGQLANDRLRGETEVQALQQNTLAYFYAIARQREATVSGRTFPRKEIDACLPTQEPAVTSILRRPSDATTLPAEIRPSVRNAVALPLRSAYDAHYKAAAAAAAAAGHASLGPSRLIATPQSDGIEVTSAANGLTIGSVPFKAVQSPLVASHAFTPSSGKAVLEYGMDGSHTSDYANVRTTQIHSLLSAPTTALYDPQEPVNVSTAQRYLAASREHSLTNLSNISGPSQSETTSGRTVMHDPRGEQTIPDHTRAHQAAPIGYGVASALEVPTDTAAASDSGNLDDSYSDVQVGTNSSDRDNNDKAAKHDLTHVYGPPTPQVLERTNTMSFLMSSPSRDTPYNRELRDWYTSANTRAERHQDFHSRIIAAHSSVASAAPCNTRPSPGVIGPPSSAHRNKAISTPTKDSPKPFNEDITRLLIPVLENLQSYVQGPEHQRHGHWAPFTAPPEWAIDRAPGGNNSFFDDDWGKPPERIGRDVRYRGMMDVGYRRGSVGSAGSRSGISGWVSPTAVRR